eukprot:gene25825-11500_t
MGDKEGTESTVRAVMAYAGLFPSWGISGSARRWWDFFINGKTNIGNERVLHHYAGALNAVPVFKHFRSNPTRLNLLRLAVAGNMGSLINIKPSGGSSMGFHSEPSLMRLDGYSADWGVGFYGHWSQASSTLACENALGWLCFCCDLVPSSSRMLNTLYTSTEANQGSDAGNGDAGYVSGSGGVCTWERAPKLRFVPRDAFRRRVFLAPLALLLEVDAAELVDVTVDLSQGRVLVSITSHFSEGLGATTPAVAVLKVQRTAQAGSMLELPDKVHILCESGGGGEWLECEPATNLGAGVYLVPLVHIDTSTGVELKWHSSL